MIDYQEVINLYRELDLNDKRNELSSILQKIDALLEELISKNDIYDKKVKNYNKNTDKDKSEDEILTFFYEDLIHIKNKLLLLTTLNTANNKKE